MIVLTSSKLGRVLTKPDISGWLAKWTVDLGEYNIQYHPRTIIKAQVLIDFLAEVLGTRGTDLEDGQETPPMWQVFMDGSSDAGGSGVDILLISPSGEETRISISLSYKAFNNEVEYEAILARLRAA